MFIIGSLDYLYTVRDGLMDLYNLRTNVINDIYAALQDPISVYDPNYFHDNLHLENVREMNIANENENYLHDTCLQTNSVINEIYIPVNSDTGPDYSSDDESD